MEKKSTLKCRFIYNNGKTSNGVNCLCRVKYLLKHKHLLVS